MSRRNRIGHEALPLIKCWVAPPGLEMWSKKEDKYIVEAATYDIIVAQYAEAVRLCTPAACLDRDAQRGAPRPALALGLAAHNDAAPAHLFTEHLKIFLPFSGFSVPSCVAP